MGEIEDTPTETYQSLQRDLLSESGVPDNQIIDILRNIWVAERLKKVMARRLSRDSRLSRRVRDNGLMIFTYRGTAD